jgi:hypothetical protein
MIDESCSPLGEINNRTRKSACSLAHVLFDQESSGDGYKYGNDVKGSEFVATVIILYLNASEANCRFYLKKT